MAPKDAKNPALTSSNNKTKRLTRYSLGLAFRGEPPRQLVYAPQLREAVTLAHDRGMVAVRTTQSPDIGLVLGTQLIPEVENELTAKVLNAAEGREDPVPDDPPTPIVQHASRKLSPHESLALSNYERHHRLEHDTATLDDVRKSDVGIDGWAERNDEWEWRHAWGADVEKQVKAKASGDDPASLASGTTIIKGDFTMKDLATRSHTVILEAEARIRQKMRNLLPDYLKPKSSSAAMQAFGGEDNFAASAIEAQIKVIDETATITRHSTQSALQTETLDVLPPRHRDVTSLW